MALDVFQWCIVGFLLLLPILYELSSTFRYHMKFVLYYLLITFIASVVMCYSIFRPFDVRNHWFILFSISYFKKLFGIETEVRGAHILTPDKPYIIVCNHQSSLDCFGMFDVWPERCVSLIKKELKYAGPFGLASYLCGTIFVDRFSHDKAIQTMQAAVHRIQNERLQVFVFPEGTRNHEGSLMPFKKGAFHLAVQAQVPIVPVVFSSFSEFYSKKDKRFTTGKFIITVLPMISTEGLTSTDVAELTERVRKQMLDTYNQTSLETTQSKLANGVKS